MAWQKILACGLVASAVFAGCTVTTDDIDDEEEDSGASTGGKSSGGTSSGGATSGGSGGKATGGTASGGTDSGPTFVCAPDKNDDPCGKCLESKCCDEWLACGEDEYCSYVSEEDPGEAICIQTCLVNQYGDAGVTDVAVCAAECQGDRATISVATNDLVNCITTTPDDGGVLQNCSTVCFNTELDL